MQDWKNDARLGQALLRAIRTYDLPLELRLVPEIKISQSQEVNSLYNSPKGILSQDTEGILNFFNPAAGEIFGYTPDEAIGMPSVNLSPPELREGRKGVFQEIVENRIMKELTTVRLNKAGERITIHAYIFPYEYLSPGISFLSIAAIVERR